MAETRRYWDCRTCRKELEPAGCGHFAAYTFRSDDGKCDRCGRPGVYKGKMTLTAGHWPSLKRPPLDAGLDAASEIAP